MSEPKTPLEQAIDQAMDAFVYAPIGLLLDGPELFPTLAERGRTQVRTARMMGQFAVQQGQTEAGKLLGNTGGPLREVLTAFGVVPAPPAAPGEAAGRSTNEKAPAERKPAKKAPAKRSAAKKAPAKKTPAKKAKTAARGASAPAASTLGIPDYDSLSASQVVKRLQGMPGAELDAVRAYEAATRARKTILNRITQLQKG